MLMYMIGMWVVLFVCWVVFFSGMFIIMSFEMLVCVGSMFSSGFFVVVVELRLYGMMFIVVFLVWWSIFDSWWRYDGYVVKGVVIVM